MAICNNCGNSWTPNPRKDLARQKKELKRLKAKERRKKAIEKIVASKFWQNEYFGYAMIFFLAPLGIFLMYRYNHKLTYSTKKKSRLYRHCRMDWATRVSCYYWIGCREVVFNLPSDNLVTVLAA